MAKEYIESTNFQNRKYNKNWVEMMSKDMLEGAWKENGETIKFDKEGNLIDGNNRMHALIKAGEINPDIKINMCVAEDVDRETATTIDIGMKRTLEHHLQFMSNCYETGCAAIVRQFMNLNEHHMSQGASTTTLRLSNTSMVETYIANQNDFLDASKFANNIHNQNKALNASEVGGIYLHLIKTLGYPKEVVEDFFERLCSYRTNESTIYKSTGASLSDKKTCRGKERIKEYMRCWNGMMNGSRTKRPSYTDGMWFAQPNKG